MSHARASGAPLTVRLGQVSRTLRRLSRRDFGVLIERMPVQNPQEKLYVTPYEVHRWAGTHEGAAVVIALASLPRNPDPASLDARIADVSDESGEWGSIVQQTTVAALVVAESLLSGEEPPADPAEGEQSADPTTSATTSRRPGSSPTTAPASAIRGT